MLEVLATSKIAAPRAQRHRAKYLQQTQQWSRFFLKPWLDKMPASVMKGRFVQVISLAQRGCINPAGSFVAPSLEFWLKTPKKSWWFGLLRRVDSWGADHWWYALLLKYGVLNRITFVITTCLSFRHCWSQATNPGWVSCCYEEIHPSYAVKWKTISITETE